MSGRTIKVGNQFEGTARQEVSFGGRTAVEVDTFSSYDIGGRTGKDSLAQSVNFNETINVTNSEKPASLDQNTDSNESRASPTIEQYKFGNEEKKDVDFRINGHLIIFNQEFKDNSTKCRTGSIADVNSLKATFSRLGMEAIVRPDLKLKDIVKEVDGLSRTDFSAHKLFVCVFMSHGHSNGMVSAADKVFNLKRTIIEPILENESLNGKAKIFITVACRGDGNYEEHDCEEYDGHILSTASGIDYSNLIISYSTYEGHVSKRTKEGTYFIQHFCDNINKDDGNTKIHSLFAKVNGQLSKMFKQVPEFHTTMDDISFRDLASTSH